MGKVRVRRTKYSPDGLSDFVEASARHPSSRRLLLDYPTVYVVADDATKSVDVYVGETADIQRRTRQHFDEARSKDLWKKFRESANTDMYVIGHEYSTRSLTLDIENRLIHFLSGSDGVTRLHNQRGNPQNHYYKSDHFDEAFREIWAALNRENDKVFPAEAVIRDSALFKASPFHRLTQEHVDAKQQILAAVRAALADGTTGHLILLEGDAGSGKTVLLSSLFNDLMVGIKDADARPRTESDTDNLTGEMLASTQSLRCTLIVNHTEQLTVYEQIARKLGFATKENPDPVLRPTRFINRQSPDVPIDVALIDEAHLLFTQGRQSYTGKNQLADIVARARVTVAVYDPKQVLQSGQYVEDSPLEDLRSSPHAQVITLTNQLRILASDDTQEWIRSFVHEGTVGDIPVDESYDLQIFDDPARMHEQI